jgi:hypothetical protein
MRHEKKEPGCQARFARKFPCFAGVAVMLSATIVTPLPARADIEFELQNLRSLPVGYRAWCEGGDLLFKSPRSARFRIAGAALCAGKPDGYTICSSDGGAARSTGNDRDVPLCSKIEAPRA